MPVEDILFVLPSGKFYSVYCFQIVGLQIVGLLHSQSSRDAIASVARLLIRFLLVALGILQAA
jgi:hypothetical protein